MAFVTARREQGSTQHPGGVMGSGEALGMAGEPAAEVRVRQVVERGGRAPGLPGSTGRGWGQRGAQAWPASLSGAANLRVVTGPAVLPSRLGPQPHPVESESQPPGFNPPSGEFYASSWAAVP